MRISDRQRRAAFAASVAVFGLVAAPLLHAELHLREPALARRGAVERLFQIAFQRERSAGHGEALARALEEALGGGAAPVHEHGAPPTQAFGERGAHIIGAHILHQAVFHQHRVDSKSAGEISEQRQYGMPEHIAGLRRERHSGDIWR